MAPIVFHIILQLQKFVTVMHRPVNQISVVSSQHMGQRHLRFQLPVK